MQGLVVCFLFGVVAFAAPSHEHYYKGHHMEHYSYPKYEFEYGVHDSHTHDMKKQWETRDGDVVKGGYKVVQPDGRVRVVSYEADGKNGFHAVVKYEGIAKHPDHGHYAHSSVSHYSDHSVPYVSSSPVGHSFESSHAGQSVHYTVDHSSAHSEPSSKLSDYEFGYSVGPAVGLESVLGHDTQEPHEYAVEEKYEV